MGGRGCSLDVNCYLSKSDKDQQSEYYGLWSQGNIKFIKKLSNSKSTSAPEFSHTADRVYVTLNKDNIIKEIGIYKDHIKVCMIHPNDKNKREHEHKSVKHSGHDELTPSHKNLINYVNKLYREHKGEFKHDRI